MNTAAKATKPTIVAVKIKTASIPYSSLKRPANTGAIAPKIAGPVNIMAVTDDSVPFGTASIDVASITGLIEYKNIPKHANMMVSANPSPNGNKQNTNAEIADKPKTITGRRPILSDIQPSNGAEPTPKSVRSDI
mgnify:CR=1 FL=1